MVFLQIVCGYWRLLFDSDSVNMHRLEPVKTRIDCDDPTQTRQLHSTVHQDSTVTLALVDADLPAPGPDDVVVRIEAAPINPSDLGVMFLGGYEHDRPRYACGRTRGTGALARGDAGRGGSHWSDYSGGE